MSFKPKIFLGGFYAATTVLPLALAMGACSPLGVGCVGITCVIGCVLYPFFGFAPCYEGFALVCAVASLFGTTAGFLAMLTAGIVLLLIPKSKDYIRIFSAPAVGGILLALALTVTVMQTTNYFGIGATGNTVIQMIQSYVSLGFHGNWRGVLYGTITLVLMITYPRKFKNLCKVIPPPFWCIVFTLPLNLWLNPVKEYTAINEVGLYSLAPTTIFGNFSITPLSILGGITAGLALAYLLLLNSRNSCKKDSFPFRLPLCLSCLLSGVFGGLPLETQSDQKQTFKQAVFNIPLSIGLCLIPLLFFPSLFSRIPLHTLAVILIAGMWHRVDWHSLKLTFTGGVKTILVFLLALFPALLITPAAGILAGAFASLLFINKKY